MASRQKLKPRVLSRKRGLKTKLGNQSEVFIKAVLVCKVMLRQKNKGRCSGHCWLCCPTAGSRRGDSRQEGDYLSGVCGCDLCLMQRTPVRASESCSKYTDNST